MRCAWAQDLALATVAAARGRRAVWAARAWWPAATAPGAAMSAPISPTAAMTATRPTADRDERHRDSRLIGSSPPAPCPATPTGRFSGGPSDLERRVHPPPFRSRHDVWPWAVPGRDYPSPKGELQRVKAGTGAA